MSASTAAALIGINFSVEGTRLVVDRSGAPTDIASVSDETSRLPRLLRRRSSMDRMAAMTSALPVPTAADTNGWTTPSRRPRETDDACPSPTTRSQREARAGPGNDRQQGRVVVEASSAHTGGGESHPCALPSTAPAAASDEDVRGAGARRYCYV